MEEIWKDVIGYDRQYKVSSLGRFMRFDQKGQPVITYGCLNKVTGYPMCSLVLNKKNVHRTLHRLIAIAFLPNPDNKEEVDHINTIRNDNRVENLRWVTRTENMNNPLSIKRFRKAFTGERSPHYGRKRSAETCKRISEALKANPKIHGRTGALCKHSIPVYQYDLDGHFIRKFDGMSEASRITGAKSISLCCSGDRHHSGGFIWRTAYAEKIDVSEERFSLMNKRVVQLTKTLEYIKTWNSTKDVQKAFGICRSAITRACSNVLFSSCGFVWIYEDEYKKLKVK